MIGCIIQARLGSTRFPQKSIAFLNRKPILKHCVENVQKSKMINRIVIATGDKKLNNKIVNLAKSLKWDIFCGHEQDVLHRYYNCAKEYKIDTIVRVTADCPLINPEIIDEVINLFLNSKVDYASNIYPERTYPDGWDVEIFTFDALEQAWKNAKNEEREHVTPWIQKNLKTINLKNHIDLGDFRWTVDYKEDLEFIESHYNSIESLKQLWKLIPAGAQTYSKSYNYFTTPVVLKRGKSCRVWDVDENEYIDFSCGLGANIIGYNDIIHNTISNQLDLGICFSQPHFLEIKLAEKLTQIIPCAEMVKFLKNGTDATTAAIKLARAFTNKNEVLCCGYHGWQDWYISTTENNKGVDKSVLKNTKTFKYGDIESVESAITPKTACIILEPHQDKGNKAFLQYLRKICDEKGIILIFDEVISGFRLSLGGAQEYYGITPDLSCFGKAIANGMPLSVVCGKKEIMQQIDNGVFISSTHGGEVLSIASALQTIHLLENGGLKHIQELGDYYLKQFNHLPRGVKMYGTSPHCGLVFENSRDASIFQNHLIKNGILSIGINNFCYSHTKIDIDSLVEYSKQGLLLIGNKNSNQHVKTIKPVFKRR